MIGSRAIKYMTGIRPSVPHGSSGNSGSEQSLHIGNYYGAIEEFIHLKGEKQFLVADSSTLSGPDSSLDTINIIRSAAAYYALGVLGDNGYMYLQSGSKNNKYFYELYTLLNSCTSVEDIIKELERRKTIEGRKYNINKLDCLDFSYPNHMAADIILANPDEIPVGESNRGNIEYAQSLITKLNARMPEGSEPLHIPKIILSQYPDRQNILGTCGTGVKMSKSDRNYLSVFTSQEKRRNEINGIVNLPVSQYLLQVIDPSIIQPGDHFEQNKRGIFDRLEDTFRAKNKVYDEIKDDVASIEGILHEGNRRHSIMAEGVIDRVRPIFFRGYGKRHNSSDASQNSDNERVANENTDISNGDNTITVTINP